jgi:hypothetical protein
MLAIHLAVTPDLRTRCGLPIDETTSTTIRMRRVTCARCQQPDRAPIHSLAVGIARRGNTFHRRTV